MKKALFLLLFSIPLVAINAFGGARNEAETYSAEENGYLTNLKVSTFGIIATDNYASTLYLINNEKLEKLYSSPGCGRYYTLSPNKEQIGFKLIKPDGMQVPVVLDIKSRTLSELHTPTKHCGQVSFGQNGEIAYTVGNILNVQKSGSLIRYNLGTYANICPISPDGKFAAFKDANGQLKTIDISTGTVAQITSNQDNYVYPSWSPDSKKLLYVTGNGLRVWDSATNMEYSIERAVNGSWSADSKWIAYQETTINDLVLKSSDIYVSSWQGNQITRITNTANIYEMGPVFDGPNSILYHTYNERSIVSKPLPFQTGKLTGPQVLFQQKQKLQIQHFDVTQFYSHGSQNQLGIVHLPGNFPYVHQKYDTPDWHIGSGSCAPTAGIMAVAHYNRLPRWETGNTKLYPHTNDFGSYVADKYRYNEFYYDTYSSPYGSDAWGGYGYMWETVSSPYNGGVKTYLEKHDIASNQVYHSSCTFQQSANEIDLGYQHVICAMLTSAGHILNAVGYVQGQQTLIFMEPYGNKNTPGWPSYDGIDVYYDWPGQNNGYQNLDASGSYGIVAWTCQARSTEVTYNDTIIDDLSYEHGFYMHNKAPSHQRYYRDNTSGGYNDHAWWTLTETSIDICYVTWTPNLPISGLYEVYTYIPTVNASATTAQYKVRYDGDSTTVVIDQSTYSGQWVSLGSFPFVQGQSGNVYLGDASGNSGEVLAIDAIKFSYRGIRVNPVVSNISCYGNVDGSITLSPTNGTAPYTYSWNPTVGSSSDSAVSNLQAGTYAITVYDALNDSGFTTLTVIEPDTIAISAGVTKPSIVGGSNGSIILNITGGTLPYSYLWNTGDAISTLQNLSAGLYSVTVSDVNGCTDSTTITVEDPICAMPYNLLAANVTSFGADLSWTSSGALTHILRFKRAVDTVWFELSIGNGLHTLSGLAAGTNYEWSVASVCSTDTSAWADSVFTSLPLNSGTTLLCSGKSTDSGGENGDHGDNESYTFTIAPAGATAITMVFSEFELEVNYDSLYIYDGLTTSAPLIGGYSSTGSPGIITATSGTLTLSFYSDISTVKKGWIAEWYAWGGTCNTLPVTTIDSTNNWYTDDFPTAFTDVDNSSFGLKDSFYTVMDFNGTEWRANVNNGFFNDNFDSVLHPDWINFDGTWIIDSAALKQTDEVPTNTNLYSSVLQDSLSAYLYHWKMKIGGSGTNKRAGVYIFCDDSTATERGNSYLVWFKPDAGQIQIWDNINNTDYLVTNESYPILKETWYDIKLTYDPVTGELSLFLDDVLISGWTDPTPIKYGSFISYRTKLCNTAFDDFTVYRSRGNSANIEIGSGPTSDLRYQNPNPTTPAGRISTITYDNLYHFSLEDNIELNIDWTPPSIIQNVNDGAGLDIDTVITKNELTACWTSSVDTNSDIKSYWYAVGTTPGGSDVVYWIENGIDTVITVSGLLSLTDGVTYYFSVKSENNAGLFSDSVVSDGQFARIIPESVFDGSAEVICVGDTVHYTNNSQNALSYHWIFEGGDIDSSNVTDPEVIYNAQGGFEVILIATGTGGVDTLIKTSYITVNPLPSSIMGVSDTVLDINFPTALFTNSSTNSSSYYWSFGDGSSSVDLEPYHTYLDTGLYSVMMIAANGMCENDTSWLTIKVEIPVAIEESYFSKSITVIPNPAHSKTTISFLAEKNTSIMIDLYNTIGEIVDKTPYKSASDGVQSIILDVSNLAKGVYLLNIQVGDKRQLQKLIIE